MRNFIKFPLMFLAAGLLGLTSCIDNTVSDEVAAIRQAQAAFINAKTAYQQSYADLRAAEAALKEAEVAAKLISNDLDRAEADRDIAAAQQQAAEALLEHQAALSGLQKDLDLQKGEDAADYLEAYREAVEDVYDANKDIWQMNTDLTKLKQLLANADIDGDGVADDGELTHAQIKAHYETQLKAAEDRLSYDSAVWAQLQTVIMDPAAFMTVRVNAEKKADELDNTLWGLEQQNYEAIQKEDDAWDKYIALWNLKADFETKVSEKTDWTNALKAEEDNLVAFIAFLTSQKTQMVTTDAKAALQLHIDLLGSVTQNTFVWGPTQTDGMHRWVADTLYNGTDGNGNFLTPHLTYQAMYDAYGYQAGDKVDGLKFLKDLDPRRANIVAIDKYIADNQAAYDAAINGGITTALSAALNAEIEQESIQVKVDAAQNELDTWNDLIADLGSIAEGAGSIEEALADAQEEIASGLVEVESLKLKLANNETSLQNLLDEIAAQEARIAEYTARVTEMEEIAAYYKSLLDAALG